MRGVSKWEQGCLEIMNSSNLWDEMYFSDLTREQHRELVNEQFLFMQKEMLKRGHATPQDIRKNIEGYAVDMTACGVQ